MNKSDTSSIHYQPLFPLFNREKMSTQYLGRTAESGAVSDSEFSQAIGLFLYEQTSLIRREVIAPVLCIYTIISVSCYFYYMKLCEDKSFDHTVEMVAPVMFALFIGAFMPLVFIQVSAKHQLNKMMKQD